MCARLAGTMVDGGGFARFRPVTDGASSRGLPPLSTVIVGTLFFFGCILSCYAGLDNARTTGNTFAQVAFAGGLVLSAFMMRVCCASAVEVWRGRRGTSEVTRSSAKPRGRRHVSAVLCGLFVVSLIG